MTETTKEKRERVRRNLRRDEEEYEEQGATAAARDAAALGKRMDELTGIGHDEALVSTFSLTRTLRDNDHRVQELTEKKIRHQLGALTTNQKRMANRKRVTGELQRLAEPYWSENVALTKIEVANLLLVDHREACKKGEDEESESTFYSSKYISDLLQKPI